MRSSVPALRSVPAVGGAAVPVVRAAAVLGAAVATVLAVVGAVLVPATVLLSAALVSLLLLALPAVTPPASATRPDTRRRARRLLTSAAAVAPVTAGAHAAGVPPQVLAATVLAAGSTVLARWLLRWEAETTGTGPVARPVDAQQGPESLADLLGVLPLDALFAEWQALRAASAGAAGDERARLVESLRLLVEELHRRDPRAAQRWLAESPSGPPDRYFDDEPRGQAA